MSGRRKTKYHTGEAGDSSLKRVKSVRFRVFNPELATWVDEQHTLWLDTRGTASFVFKVPEEVVTALSVKNQVNAPTADHAERTFQSLMTEYGEWKKTADAKDVIVMSVTCKEPGYRFSMRKPEGSAFVDIAYYRAFEINGKVYAREEKFHFNFETHKRENETIVPGNMIPNPGGVVLDYTEILHAQIDKIIAAINQAGETLTKLVASDNVAQAILEFGQGLQPALPAPAVVEEDDDEL